MSVVKINFFIACALIFVSYSGSVSASKCFEKSSFVNKGGDVYLDQVIPVLKEKDFHNLQGIFKSAKGQWKGEMSTMECFGTPKSTTVKSEIYQVKAAAEFDGREFHLELDLYSPTSKSGKTTELDYILEQESFRINPRKSGKAEVLDSTPTGVRYYKRFRLSRSGQSGTLVNETYYVFEVFKNNAVFSEFQYLNGELVQESITKLAR